MELYDKLIRGAQSACVKAERERDYLDEKQTAFTASIAQSVLAIALMMQEKRKTEKLLAEGKDNG